jgi:hypothetical protein
MSSSFGVTLDGLMRETLLIGLHHLKFKNGAFVDLITKDNSVVDAMEVLLASTHLSSFEKEIVKICQEQFITLRNRFPGLEQPDHLDRLPLVASVDKLSEIFNKDAEGRGLYVPPSMMIQTVNKDGNVKESRVVNKDGTAAVEWWYARCTSWSPGRVHQGTSRDDKVVY